MKTHALTVLQFDEARSLVAGYAASPLGAAELRSRTPVDDPDWIGREIDAVAEAMHFLQRVGGLSIAPLPDLREALGRLRVEGSVWDAPTLWAARELLSTSETVREGLLAPDPPFPLLAARAEQLATLPGIAAEIDRTIDAEGEVRDDASPELLRLRREIRRIRGGIVDRLTAVAASLPSQYQVPDASVSVREGRYVIPVRREGRSVLGGIVHGESATGATLFVEPPAAIELMNRLREMEAAEAREVHRILRALTARLRPHEAELRTTLDALIELDSLFARARYAREVDASPPTLLAPGAREYDIVAGRHPLLLAGAGETVPFHLRMEPDERTLLISGPNTGGKTVLLKAIGLISLLVQSGILPPVGPGTRLPVFRRVFADIGDEQSIEASLSTFSAHLQNLREILEDADGDSLVLIDEIGSGTDPVEGGALARAVLMQLTRRGAFSVATTHLGQLKLLAGEVPGVVNASLQFDAERLRPTYRLLKGLPGRSYGLAIARRLGLPPEVLRDAEEALPQGEQDVAKLLLELEAKEQRLSDATIELERRLGETERLRAELRNREEALDRRERNAERRSRQQARDLLLNARRKVEIAIQEVRDAADSADVDEAARSARRTIEEAARQQREKEPEPRSPDDRPRAPAVDLTPGTRVRVQSLRQTGTILELRDDRAMVEAGSLRLLLPQSDLAPLPPGDQKPGRSNGRHGGGGYVAAELEASSEVDLRGLRAHELEGRLGRALDSALLAGLPSFRIIHGKGTGALRERVQELVQDDPRISAARPGERFEGGTGVTVVEFR